MIHCASEICIEKGQSFQASDFDADIFIFALAPQPHFLLDYAGFVVHKDWQGGGSMSIATKAPHRPSFAAIAFALTVTGQPALGDTIKLRCDPTKYAVDVSEVIRRAGSDDD
jgi:hypothetical protein